jgi:hypothetical protein
VLNHVQDKIPATYDVHDYLDEKRDALQKWAQFLGGLLPSAATTVAGPPRIASLEPLGVNALPDGEMIRTLQ